ncbi:putative baseplate assembly protein [Sphingomonas sp.]|uniref:putative baseplate assembly protein n=1 Tax=Sphingomonas sp. TaxID=28214 RepID=UPI0035BC7EBB
MSASPDQGPGQARCDAPRRAAVRRAALNGLDEVEVDAGQTSLRVTFLGHAPEWLAPANVIVEGGPGQRAVATRDIRVDRGEDEGLDDVMTVWLDRPGDSSEYRLLVRALDPRGKPTLVPDDFDPRYAGVAFDFKASCPTEGDCAAADTCPPPAFSAPPIDYLARDYQGFRRLMLDRLALTLPDWSERHAADLGITLVEAIATTADTLSYYQDAVATEAYLGTARQRISVRRHARLVDYALHEGAAARGWAAFTVTGGDLTLDPAAVLLTAPVPGVGEAAVPVVRYLEHAQPDQPAYEIAGDAPVILREARNVIGFYRWEETGCRLPRGTTRATLFDPGSVPPVEAAAPLATQPAAKKKRGAAAAPAEGEQGPGPQHILGLAAGQVLVFAEVLGPRTGRAEDADPAHRHAVRLTHAVRGVDRLTGTLVWEVEWCAEDALPFALCLDAVGAAPDCTWRDGISVAYGNVTLVSAGASRTVDLPPVPADGIDPVCASDCEPAEDRERAGRYRPRLPAPDLTFALPVPRWRGDCRSAAAARIVQTDPDPDPDPAAALPAIRLTGTLGDEDPRAWTAVADLLGSGPDDRHFVVEVDDDRVAWLRFGDGDCGAAPRAGERFTAAYRTGNGAGTNLGSDALGLVVFRNGFPDGIAVSVRNPLPLTGGTAPEPVMHARLAAPHRYRSRLERAVTPADYAAIVERDFSAEVQRAAAAMRRSGAAWEVQVTIDPIGGGTPAPGLIAAITAHLQAFRRIGHDVRVLPAREVPVVVAMTVCIAPGYLREAVGPAVRRALGPQGLFAPDAWTFGAEIAASRLIAAAQAVQGVAHVHLDRLERQFAGDDGELDTGVLRLGAQQVPVLADDPRSPGRGTLTLRMGGGR